MLFPPQACQQNHTTAARCADRQVRHFRGSVLGGVAAISMALMAWAPGADAEYFVPTSLGGNLTYGYGYSRIAAGESEQTNLTLSINGGGFFWQPWFLTLGAGVGLGLSESDSNTSAGTTAKTVSTSVDFTLFPESRFPTSFGFSLSDSRQEVQENVILPGQHYQVRRFYVRQNYSAANGANINAWFYQNSVSISGQNDDSMDRSLGFQVQKHQSHHDFDFSGNFLFSYPALSDIETSSANLAFSHNYSPSAEVGVSSLVSYTNAQTTSDTFKDFNFSYEQVSSSFYWRPEHRPYQVTGGVLFATSGASSRRVNTNANASYRLTRNVNAGVGVFVGVSDSQGQQSVDSTQSASLNAFSDQYSIAGFDYGWNTSLGASNSISRTDSATSTAGGDGTLDSQSLSLSAGHRISRGYNLGRFSTFSVSGGQGVGMSKTSTTNEVTNSVSNSASAGWSHYGFGGSTSTNVSVSDSRTLGNNDSEFQVASAQLGRIQEISRLSSLSGNVNFQANRSVRTNAITGEEVTTGRSASASFNYAHARFLGLHGLQYSSQLVFPSLIKSENTVSQAGNEWNNTLNYRVGLLGLGMTARVAELGGGERAYTMTFQAMRQF